MTIRAHDTHTLLIARFPGLVIGWRSCTWPVISRLESACSDALQSGRSRRHLRSGAGACAGCCRRVSRARAAAAAPARASAESSEALLCLLHAHAPRAATCSQEWRPIVGDAARLRVPQRCKRGHRWCPATSARLRPTFDVEGARTTPLRALKDARGGVKRGQIFLLQIWIDLLELFTVVFTVQKNSHPLTFGSRLRNWRD